MNDRPPPGGAGLSDFWEVQIKNPVRNNLLEKPPSIDRLCARKKCLGLVFKLMVTFMGRVMVRF